MYVHEAPERVPDSAMARNAKLKAALSILLVSMALLDVWRHLHHHTPWAAHRNESGTEKLTPVATQLPPELRTGGPYCLEMDPSKATIIVMLQRGLS